MKPILPVHIDGDKKNYVVQYHPYDPLYPALFERIRGWIQAEAYGRVKREVLAAGHNNGETYQQAKTPFIVELNARLRQVRQAD